MAGSVIAISRLLSSTGRWRNGRRCGLKIRWGNTPYGFDSHPPYRAQSRPPTREGFVIPGCYASKLTPSAQFGYDIRDGLAYCQD